MLVGVTGPLSSGVRTLARMLVDGFAFKPIIIDKDGTRGTVVSPDELRVQSVSAALELVTPDWRGRYVVLPVTEVAEFEVLRHRPFFYLVALDAPLMLRYSRFKDSSPEHAGFSLEEFVARDDALLFGKTGQCKRRVASCTDRILVNSGSLEELRQQLVKLDPTNDEHVRPSWDTYFMRLAQHAASRSNCMKRRVGAVMVRDRRIVATGYNGTPRGTPNCNAGGCERCNSGAGGASLQHCYCLHAEENAILEAGRQTSEGTTLYTTTFPCLHCAKKIIQIGVSEVVYGECYLMDEISGQLLRSVGIRLRQHSL